MAENEATAPDGAEVEAKEETAKAAPKKRASRKTSAATTSRAKAGAKKPPAAKAKKADADAEKAPAKKPAAKKAPAKKAEPVIVASAKSRLEQLYIDEVKATLERNHIERLKQCLETTASDTDGSLYLCHALAKEYEDLGDDTKALDYLSRGNARKRKEIGYSIDQDRSLFEAVERVCDRSFVERAAGGCLTEEPLFVVGMPRTGTTLVERILTSHSSVFSAGELQAFGLALKRASRSASNHILDADTVEQGAKLNFEELGQRYLASTRPATGRTAHFVDKMPMNFFYIGFIQRALPNARIVCLRRHPMDTCLSNLRQLFRLNHSYYNYAYDLSDIAEYYILFDRLMAHWDRALPGRVLQLHYEDLVADQEAQSRQLLEFCGLEWEDACLRFHENKSPIATASAVQARQPIYAGSMDRWKRYGERLDPLRKQLEAAGIEIE